MGNSSQDWKLAWGDGFSRVLKEDFRLCDHLSTLYCNRIVLSRAERNKNTLPSGNGQREQGGVTWLGLKDLNETPGSIKPYPTNLHRAPSCTGQPHLQEECFCRTGICFCRTGECFCRTLGFSDIMA